MEEFKVSVIIPVYKAKNTVVTAVDSALNQPETHEVILVYDGSGDGTWEVCANLTKKHEKVKLTHHHDFVNKGAGASRNQGAQYVTCEYLSFLDADDVFLDNRFLMDKDILKDTNIDGVFGATTSHFLDLETQKKRKKMFTAVRGEVSSENLFFKMSPFGNSGHFTLNSLTLKRSSFFEVGGFDEQLRLTQDTHFITKLSIKCELSTANRDNIVSSRGIHVGNRSYSIERLQKYRPLLYRKLYSWSLEHNVSIKQRAVLWQAFYRSQLSTQSLFYTKFNLLMKMILKDPVLISHKLFWLNTPLVWRLVRK